MAPSIPVLPGWLLPFRMAAFILLLCWWGELSVLSADIVLRTGEGGPLQTATVPLIIPNASIAPQLTFEFAFATDETPQPGAFHDSFTFTLQTTNQSSLAILLTLDAFGLQVAPPTPGGVMIPPGSLQTTPIPYFGSAGDPAVRAAYAVLFNVPGEFTAQPNNAFFDLFDNFNGVPSVGYLRNLNVVPVPEPGAAWLLIGGAFLLGLFNRSRK